MVSGRRHTVRGERLDAILVSRGLADSTTQAAAIIRAGLVLVADRRVDKPGAAVPAASEIRIKNRSDYVSRGGLKLAQALQEFTLDPTGWICADIGAATGGFTDCLLQHGAAHVFSVDVGYGLLAWKLRTDQRVTVCERVNARAITADHITMGLDLAVFDTSFISLAKVVVPVLPLFRKTVRIIALIKPQFELPPKDVDTGGIVKDAAKRLAAIREIRDFFKAMGLAVSEPLACTTKGKKGNQEYLVYMSGEPDSISLSGSARSTRYEPDSLP